MAESRLAVYGAIAANVAIAVTKFIAAGITGSSSMLSEGIHSLVDTGNGLLLLVGMKRSRQPASAEHPYGHGKELYFWSLIVGVMIFGVGGGISFYEGILHVLHPPPLQDPGWNYGVLACAAVFEGASFTVAFRQLSKERRGRSLWRMLRVSKDPATFTVVAEDSAALVGLSFAAIGVFLSHRLDRPELDGAASMAIGLLLAGVAILLIRESRGLLVGEGLSPQTIEEIRKLAVGQDGVRRVGPVLSMYLGPDEVLLTFEVHVEPQRPSGELAAAVRRIEHEVRERWPRVKRIYIELRTEPAPQQ